MATATAAFYPSDWGVRACGDLAGNGDQALPKLSQPTAVCDHHATGGALSSTGTAIGCAAGRLLWLAQHLLTLTLMGIVLVVSTGLQTNEIAEPKTTSIAQDIKGLLKSKTYLGNVMMFACASAAFFAYLTGMPEIMAQLGYQARDIGLSFIPQTIAFMVGGYLGKKAVQKYGDELVLKQLIALFTLSAAMILSPHNGRSAQFGQYWLHSA